jgi:hypothetical protein
MDDYLPIYARILDDVCPIPTDNFPDAFDSRFARLSHKEGKTAWNHRTENAGKLLGMYYEKDGVIHITQRTRVFLETNDQPAFFKSVCFKFQQPNGSQKIQTIKEKVRHKIRFKPYHFVIKLLKLASENNVVLARDEIAYYVLNSLEVLQDKVPAEDVLARLLSDRKRGINVKVEVSGKAYSYAMQHINAQFDYLMLANLIRKDDKRIWLNSKEKESVAAFIKDLNRRVSFDIYRYDLNEDRVASQIERDWQDYFGNVTERDMNQMPTNLASLDLTGEIASELAKPEVTAIGDEGENFVIRIERDRVKIFNPRLVNKINHHGKAKGLGYDITSIEADRDPKNPEYLRYIEVKSTKRVNPPDFSETMDSIYLTRNEWVAAEQQAVHYYIYRVYFTNHGVYVNTIKNPVLKSIQGKLFAVPTVYRLEFDDKAVDEKQKFKTLKSE